MRWMVGVMMLLMPIVCVYPVNAQRAISEFPYYTGFETEADSVWTVYANAGLNNWRIGDDTAAVRSGQKALYISDGNGYAYTVQNNQCYSYVTLLINISEEQDYEFRFDWKCAGENNWDFFRVWVAPDTVVPDPQHSPVGDNDRYHTGSPEGWMPLGDTRYGLSPAWSTLSYTLSLAPGVHTVVFMWRNDNNGGQQPPAAIDNFYIIPHSCHQPTGLTVDMGSVDALVSWQGGETGATYNVYLEDSLVATGVASNSYVLQGLMPDASYRVSVQTQCSEDTLSATASMRFHTHCMPVSELPYVMDFETIPAVSNPIPNCWERYNSLGGSFPYVNQMAVHAHSGSNSLYWYMTPGSLSPDTTMIIMPWIDETLFSLDSLGLSFWAQKTTPVTFPIQVGVISRDLDPSSFVADTFLLLVDTAYEHFQVHIGTHSDYEGGHIAIMVQRPNGYSALYIDDIVLDRLPPCSSPELINVWRIGPTEAAVSWLDTLSEHWQLKLNFDSHSTYVDIPRSEVLHRGDTLVYHIAGLTPTRGYSMSVRSICPYGDVSEWSEALPFHTDCLPITLPYYENFLPVSHTAYCWMTLEDEELRHCTVVQDGDDYRLRLDAGTAADGVREYTFSPRWNYYGSDSLLVEVYCSASAATDTLYFGYVDHEDEVVWIPTPCVGHPGMTTTLFSLMIPPQTSGMVVQYRGTAGAFAYIDSVNVTPHVYIPPTSCYVNGQSSDVSHGVVYGGGRYVEGREVQLVAVPRSLYMFDHWSNGDTTDTLRFVVTCDTSFVATFKRRPCEIVAVSSDINKGTVTGGGIYNPGDVAVLVATAHPGYRLNSWSNGFNTPVLSFVVENDASFVAYFDVLGIFENDATELAVGVRKSSIVVSGAEGMEVCIFDLSGRLLYRQPKAAGTVVWQVNNAGTYMVKVGDAPARKVVVTP